MLMLRFCQLLLVLFALACFWYASRRDGDEDLTVRVSAIIGTALFALVFTQVLPLAWLAAAGTVASARITGIDCEPGKKHYLRFEFMATERKIRGLVLANDAGQPCEALTTGDELGVTYIGTAPQVLALGSVRSQLFELILGCFLAGLAGAMISYVGIRKRLHALLPQALE